MKRETSNSSGVYAIRRIGTDKMYIGSSKNFANRCKSHDLMLKNGSHHCKHLQYSWNKYGEDAFEFVILENCLSDRTLLFAREQHWLDKCKRHLYNHSRDAEVGYSIKRTPEQRQEISRRMIGNKHTLGKNVDRKYTEKDIRLMFSRYADGESMESIAKYYGTHIQYIRSILSRVRRKNISIDQDTENSVQARLRDRALGKDKSLERGKLTGALILEISARLDAGERIRDLINEYGLSRPTLNRIKNRKTYNNLLGERKHTT